MSVHKVYIIDASNEQPVEAELHDDLPADVLLDVEDQWAESRDSLRTQFKALGITQDNWPESLHWDWGRKGVRMALSAQRDSFRIMALRRQPVWEAAILAICRNHTSLLPPEVGKPLVYIDYLEVAPWNWTVDPFQVRRFKAAGPVMIRAAIELSFAMNYSGRLGLHALPQAELFYQSQGFQLVKDDSKKQHLPYYELSASEALLRTERK